MPLYAHWILFTFFIIFIFFGFFGMLAYTWKKNTPSEEQKRISSLNCLKFIGFYWLIDFFYMACFNDWLIWKFIFGCLIMIIIFYNLSNAFISQNSKTGFQKFGLLQDFLLGVAMTIYLLYIIPNKSLQDIMIPVISAIYGGLITLVGVAWTIKFTKKESVENKVLENKPLIFCDPLNDSKDFIPIHFCEFKTGNVEIVSIVNSDKVQFSIKSIKVNDAIFSVQGINFLNKGQTAHLYFKIDETITIDKIIMNVEAIDGKQYSFQLLFKTSELTKNKLLLEQIEEV